jgi:hypothetical protein
VVGLVTAELCSCKTSEEWASLVAWSNLYKIAPAIGFNPNGVEAQAQEEACGGLLTKELALWKPAAAVFLTETKRRGSGHSFQEIDNDWFGKYRPLFTFTNPLRPRARRDGNPLVHSGTARIEAQEIRIVVALRPENISGDRLCHEIVAALRD